LEEGNEFLYIGIEARVLPFEVLNWQWQLAIVDGEK
jgi:hypothetical protein